MAIYIFLFLCFLIPALQQAITHKRNDFFYVVIIASSIIVAVRYQIGNDWRAYVDYYTGTPGLFDIKFSEYSREWLFFLFFSFFKTFGCPYQVAFFFFSLVTSWVLLYAIKKFYNRYLFLSFLIYFSYHFLQYETNMIRHGMAASWIFLSMYYSSKENLKKYIICVMVAFMFQSIGIIFLPFYWLYRINLNKKWLLVIFGACLFVFISIDLFALVGIAPLFQDNVDYYLNDYYAGKDVTSYGITTGILFNLVIALYARFFALKKEYQESMAVRVAINALLYSFFFALALNSVAIFVERIVGILNMTIIIILPMLMDFINKRYRLLFLCGILAYCIMFFTAIMHTKGGPKDQFQYIPYSYKL